MKKIHWIKVTIFCMIFISIFHMTSKIVTSSSDYRNYQWIRGFYEEKEDSLDAVYIGSSTCYAFWNSVVSWKEFGITVWPYACHSQPFEAAQYLIEETKKTQSDAVFIINIKLLTDDGEISTERMHYLLDYMPFSETKLKLTRALSEKSGYSFSESLELYFPIIRYHSRWSELNENDFSYEIDGLKGASYYGPYLQTSVDLSEKFQTTDTVNSLSSFTLNTVDSLLAYCKEEEVKVLFVAVPQVLDKEEIQSINAMAEYISNQGFDVLSLLDDFETIGLDLSGDFYNSRHTNIHGSIKYTRHLSEYLTAYYDLEDKRGLDEYSDWDDAFSMYEKIISPYVLDIELNGSCRDYTLNAINAIKVIEQDEDVYLSWDAVERVDGYAIYRKEDEWKQLACVEKESYIDFTCKTDTTYVYTVVPYVEKNGEKYYGNISYSGVTFKT